MTIVSKEALLAKRSDTETGFPEDLVPIEGLGEVRVRGLSRFEVLHTQSVPDTGGRTAAVERRTVALGVVDPPMTEAEVGQWQKSSLSGELDAVTYKIGELSGMLEGSAKAAYKKFEEEPGSEFRVLPSAEARDVGGPTAAPDEQ